MNFRPYFVLFSVSLLTACVAQQSVNPQQPGVSPSQPVEVQSAQGEPVANTGMAEQPRAEPVVVEQNAPVNVSNQIEQLTGRLTLVQEQMINQRSLSEQQLELSQAILQRLQLLTQTSLLNDSATAQASSTDSANAEQLDAAVNQLLQVANEMQMSASSGGQTSGEWEIASVVTAKGWILIRYKPSTGKTWLAENGSWTELVDRAAPGTGQYALYLERRDTDSKGYVAVKINKSTGDTWWLNDRTWQAY